MVSLVESEQAAGCVDFEDAEVSFDASVDRPPIRDESVYLGVERLLVLDEGPILLLNAFCVSMKSLT